MSLCRYTQEQLSQYNKVNSETMFCTTGGLDLADHPANAQRDFATRQQSGKYLIFIIQFKIYFYSPDDRIVDEIKKMKVEMDIKFQNMDANFQQMDAKFQQIDAKFEEMKERSNTSQNQYN